MQSVNLTKVVSGALGECLRSIPTQALLRSKLVNQLLQLRFDVLRPSEKRIALGDGNRAESSGPSVHILKRKMMDTSQMVCVEGSANRIFVKLEEACKEVITFKLAQAIRIAYVG